MKILQIKISIKSIILMKKLHIRSQHVPSFVLRINWIEYDIIPIESMKECLILWAWECFTVPNRGNGEVITLNADIPHYY